MSPFSFPGRESTVYNAFYGVIKGQREGAKCTPPAGKSSFDPLRDEPRLGVRQLYGAYMTQKILKMIKNGQDERGACRSTYPVVKASPPRPMSGPARDECRPNTAPAQASQAQRSARNGPPTRRRSPALRTRPDPLIIHTFHDAICRHTLQPLTPPLVTSAHSKRPRPSTSHAVRSSRSGRLSS
ncbi:hypothetical protein FOL47_007804 [Perkinsus chesapeaki]|uniref:Uncharacterized protein n=1 Tax=Perkinsus chesapeaki TaxID=330153 RepID=A0A7J6LHR3_PERCH|nr:hypothetical protein FOL47_007804 [Perkinsus chesapeaki]